MSVLRPVAAAEATYFSVVFYGLAQDEVPGIFQTPDVRL